MQPSLLRVYEIIRFFVKGKMTISYKFICAVVSILPSSPSFIPASYQLAYHGQLAALLNTFMVTLFTHEFVRNLKIADSFPLFLFAESIQKIQHDLVKLGQIG